MQQLQTVALLCLQAESHAAIHNGKAAAEQFKNYCTDKIWKDTQSQMNTVILIYTPPPQLHNIITYCCLIFSSVASCPEVTICSWQGIKNPRTDFTVVLTMVKIMVCMHAVIQFLAVLTSTLSKTRPASPRQSGVMSSTELTAIPPQARDSLGNNKQHVLILFWCVVIQRLAGECFVFTCCKSKDKALLQVPPPTPQLKIHVHLLLLSL